MKNAFYIASRYLIAKKGSTAVTFITWLAAFAMVAAVAAMFIIISVFSGLEDINKQMIANLHADLTIKSKTGKVLKDIGLIRSVLKKESAVAYFSSLIEEKVYLGYKDNGEIAYLRGVDSAYTNVNPINENIFYGKFSVENVFVYRINIGVSRIYTPQIGNLTIVFIAQIYLFFYKR